jgi:hypothetical protein
MNRIDVIQRIINKTRGHTYLEIGVAGGASFLPIKARQKIAVDPNFNISKRRKIKWTLKNFYNIVAKYYKLSSDSFFANIKFFDGLDFGRGVC